MLAAHEKFLHAVGFESKFAQLRAVGEMVGKLKWRYDSLTA